MEKHFPKDIKDIFYKLLKIILDFSPPDDKPYTISPNEIGRLYNAFIDKINEGELRKINNSEEYNNLLNKKMPSTAVKYCRYETDEVKFIGSDDGLYGIKDPF